MSKKKHHLSAEEVEALSFSDGHLFHDIYGTPRPTPRVLAPVADTHGHLGSLHEHSAAESLARAAAAGVRMLIVPVDIATEFPRKWADTSTFIAWFEDTLSQARAAYTKLAEADLCVPCDLPAEYLFEHTYFVVGAHPYSAPE